MPTDRRNKEPQTNTEKTKGRSCSREKNFGKFSTIICAMMIKKGKPRPQSNLGRHHSLLNQSINFAINSNELIGPILITSKIAINHLQRLMMASLSFLGGIFLIEGLSRPPRRSIVGVLIKKKSRKKKGLTLPRRS